MNKKKIGLIVLGLVLFIASNFLPLPLSFQAKIVLGISLLAAVYWFSEALPLHVTGLLASFLLLLTASLNLKQITALYLDPVIVLLFGGFVLAVALQKYKLDELIAFKILRLVGKKPERILFGLMLVTWFFSMWMSNTASTAIMLPIALTILVKNKLNALKSSYGKALVLGIAFAATIGGIATLVGTTPNPLAAKYLRDAGQAFSFIDWMYYALPFAIILLLVAWIVLIKLFKPEIRYLKTIKIKPIFDKQKKSVLLVFALTVFLWLTTSFHGISSAAIALIPAVLFYLFSLLENKDFKRVNWGILLLIGSGLSLGAAIQSSGLDLFFAGLLENFIQGQPLFLVYLGIILFAIALTVFVSNTAAAALMIPLIMPLAPLIGVNVRILVLLTAIAVSLDFIVPVGTPPNAIAYSSGYVKVKDMAKAGSIIALIAALMLSGLALLYW